MKPNPSPRAFFLYAFLALSSAPSAFATNWDYSWVEPGGFAVSIGPAGRHCVAEGGRPVLPFRCDETQPHSSVAICCGKPAQ